MGSDFNGFYSWITYDVKETRFYICGSRHFDQKCTFYPVKTTYQAPEIARVFINEIVRLHGIPKKIISDRGSIFMGIFWTSFQEALGTQLNFSTTYHLKTDGQTERINQILEDML
jgi:hypothetical protein